MNELLREIEEDVRRERMEKLWNSVGKFMVGASIAIVLATIVIVIVQNARQSREEQQTALFMKGLERRNVADYAGAITAFSTLTSDPGSSYYGLAMLQKAQAQKDDGNTKAAADTYAALAGSDNVFGGLATMLSASKDKLIEPNKASPFYDSESEWKGWQLLAQRKKDEAATIFLALRNNPDAPFSLRRRMNAVLQHMAPEKVMTDNQAKDIDAQ